MAKVTDKHIAEASEFYEKHYKGRILGEDGQPLGKAPKTIVKLKELMAQARANGERMQDAAKAYFKEKGFKVAPKDAEPAAPVKQEKKAEPEKKAPPQKTEKEKAPAKEKADVKVTTIFKAQGAKAGQKYKLADGTEVEATGQSSKKTAGAFLFKKADGKLYPIAGDTALTEVQAEPEKKAEQPKAAKPQSIKVEDAKAGERYEIHGSTGVVVVTATGKPSQKVTGAFLFKYADDKLRPVSGTVMPFRSTEAGQALDAAEKPQKEDTRKEHVEPVSEAMDPAKMDKAVLRATLDELSKGGHKDATWSKTDSEVVLRDRIKTILDKIYTPEVLAQVDAVDPEKVPDCTGVMPDMTSPSCIACPTKPECIRLFQVNIKEAFSKVKQYQDELAKPGTAEKEPPKSATDKPAGDKKTATKATDKAIAIKAEPVNAKDAVKGGQYLFNGKLFTATGQPSKNTAGAFLFTGADKKTVAIKADIVPANAIAYGVAADADEFDMVTELLTSKPTTMKALGALIEKHFEIGTGADAEKNIQEWTDNLQAAGILQ